MKNDIPAFPVPDMRGDEHGMSLRDYFAGQFLVGAACKQRGFITSKGHAREFAKEAYLLADAMLANLWEEK